MANETDVITGLLDNNGFMTVISIIAAGFLAMSTSKKRHLKHNTKSYTNRFLLFIFSLFSIYILFLDVFHKLEWTLPFPWILGFDRQSTLLLLSILLVGLSIYLTRRPKSDENHLISNVKHLISEGNYIDASNEIDMLKKSPSDLTKNSKRTLNLLLSDPKLVSNLVNLYPEKSIEFFNDKDLDGFLKPFWYEAIHSKTSLINSEVFSDDNTYISQESHTYKIINGPHFSDLHNDFPELSSVISKLINEKRDYLSRPHEQEIHPLRDHWGTPFYAIIELFSERIKIDLINQNSNPGFNIYRLYEIFEIILDKAIRSEKCDIERGTPSRFDYLINEIALIKPDFFIKDLNECELDISSHTVKNLLGFYVDITVLCMTNKFTTKHQKTSALSNLAKASSILETHEKGRKSDIKIELIKVFKEKLRNSKLSNDQLQGLWYSIPEHNENLSNELHLLGDKYIWNKEFNLSALSFK